MAIEDRRAIDALTDRLAGIIAARGIAVERRTSGIAVTDLDLSVAVATAWDDLGTPPRIFGVEFDIRSETLFGGTAREYSYGAGVDIETSAQIAMESWVDFDLPVLIDAAGGRADGCVHMTMESDGRLGSAVGTWQIVMGPLYYLAGDALQPCCQSCLMTMSLPALMPLLAEPASCAIRLFAARNRDGTTSADCRRNGVDMPDTAHAIGRAAEAWPALSGLQMRRQYLYFKAPSDGGARGGFLREAWARLGMRRGRSAG